jgi:hypothetical protein
VSFGFVPQDLLKRIYMACLQESNVLPFNEQLLDDEARKMATEENGR